MSNPTGRDLLVAECQTLSRYLTGDVPGDVVVNAYCRAHDQGAVAQHVGAFDRLLIRIARGGPRLAKAADAYAAAFARTAVLRKKLVLLLAILETSWPSSGSIDSVVAGSRLRLMATVGLRTGMFAATALVTALPLTPLRLGCAVIDRRMRP